MKIISVSKPKLQFLVETPEEAYQAIQIYRPKLKPYDQEFIDIVNLNNPVFQVQASDEALRGNGGWHQVAVVTDYLNPYWDLLDQWTGKSRFELDLTPVIKEFCHTGIRLSLKTDEYGDATFELIHEVFAYLGEWMLDEDQAERPARYKQAHYSFSEWSEQKAIRHVRDLLGKAIVQQQYLRTSKGLLYENPDYGRKQTEYQPSVENSKVWKFIWDAWVEQYASPEQKAVIDRIATVQGDSFRGPQIYSSYSRENILHLDKYHAQITADEFKALGTSEVNNG